jgi:uncharacterized protein (TIGR00255 family)
MTGYGYSNFQNGSYEIAVEIKTLNNRFLDISISTNSEISHIEPYIRTFITENIRRGKVYVTVNLAGDIQIPLELNKELLKILSGIYLEAYKALSSEKQPDIDELLTYEGVILRKQQKCNDDAILTAIKETLAACYENYRTMSEAEGNKIRKWLTASMKRIEEKLSDIEAHIPHYRLELKERLQQTIKEIITPPVDKDIEKRLMVEVAFYMDRYDVNEEIVRMKDHLEKMEEILTKDERESGKRMNFVVQEMQREIQTLSSKFNNIKVFPAILSIKEEIEKCRELIQNVE